MLTAVEIQNYRGIRQGRISGFGSVNLFLGRNGSGKSSALEAIFLAAYQQSKDFDFHGFHLNQPLPLISLRHSEDRFPSIEQFYRKDPLKEIIVQYYFDNTFGSFHINSSQDGGTQSISVSMPPDIATYFKRMKLVDIRVLLDRTIEQRGWDELLRFRGDRELRRVMNDVYALNLESLTYSVHTQSLKALFADRDYALNIDDLGAGMRITFRMFMAILLSEGSAVLAEEFDEYQHIESFPRFVKALFAVSTQARAQLFLATHRTETVRNFVEQAGSQSPKADLKIFQTALANDGLFEASGFSVDEADALINGGFDLRRTT